jgi:hypothetical protein
MWTIVMRFGSWSGGGCSVTTVDGNVSRLWVILNINDSGGFGHGAGVGSGRCKGLWVQGFVRQDPVLGLFTNGSVPSTMPKIWLTCTPDNTTLSGSCQWVGLFLLSNYYISSSSSKSICVGTSGFFYSGPELGPSPGSLSFFFRSSTQKM